MCLSRKWNKTDNKESAEPPERDCPGGREGNGHDGHTSSLGQMSQVISALSGCSRSGPLCAFSERETWLLWCSMAMYVRVASSKVRLTHRIRFFMPRPSTWQ